MHRESAFRIVPNWRCIGNVAITSQFFDMVSWSNFFDAALCLLSILLIAPSFTSMASLALEL